MCEHAGTFMRTRIDSLWPELLSLHRKLSREITSGMSKSQQQKQQHQNTQALITRNLELGYVDTSTKQLWHSLEDLLVVIVKDVEVDAEKFDDVLRMLAPIAGLDEGKRSVLEEFNGDAVWLAEFRTKPRELNVPKSSRFAFAQAV